MSLLALLGAYNSNLGSSPIPLQASAMRLVLLTSRQTAVSSVMQLETGTTEFGFLRTCMLSNLCSAKVYARVDRCKAMNMELGCAAFLPCSKYLCIKHSAAHALIDDMHI